MLISISVPATNERGPAHIENALAAIHEACGHAQISFLFGRHANTVRLYVRVPRQLAGLAESQLAAAYPDSALERLPEDALDAASNLSTWSTTLSLKPDIFPIRRYPQFADAMTGAAADPLSGLLAVLAPTGAVPVRGTIEIIVRPASHRRCHRARRSAAHLGTPFFRSHHVLAELYTAAVTSRHAALRTVAYLFAGIVAHPEPTSRGDELTTTSTRTHDREEDVQAASDKLGRHLFEAHIHLHADARHTDGAQAEAKLREMAAAFAQFTLPRLATFHGTAIRSGGTPAGKRRGFLLSCQELATLWHPATASVRAPTMEVTGSRDLEPPAVIPSQTNEANLAVLGRVKFRSRRELFGIRSDDRRRHLAILGKTGMGKSTLLLSLIASDIQAGRGVAVIDPHGDLAEAVLTHVPRRRTNEVLLFDAGDREFPVAFNVLACRHPDDRPLVASGVVGAFKKLYGDSWGPRLEHILRNAILALLETPGASLVSVLQLLGDAGYRKAVTARVTDPLVRQFWESEFGRWKPAFQAEAVAPIQNKVGQFLSSPVLRAITGQAKTSLDLRDMMDRGRILIVNLSKGRVGEDASGLLGALLVTGLQLAAMSRASIPERERRDFYLYVDEFQNFATGSFATILSEARKYRLNLTIANQYLAQLDDATADAVFGNVGSLLAFQVGTRDAEVLAEQFGGGLTPEDLMQLPRYGAYVRLLIDGMPSRPFSMQTLPMPGSSGDEYRADVIRRTSRHRYGRPAVAV